MISDHTIAALATSRLLIAAGIGDNAAKLIPCNTLFDLEFGVTLFLEDNFQISSGGSGPMFISK